ncbi:MAG: Arm DNA-binding domain-containing protein [Bacteroides cellulosilyticus]
MGSKASDSHKGKIRIPCCVKYIDGTERTQQKSGFRTEKESNAARDNTIGKLHAGTYIVYENVKVSDFLRVLAKGGYMQEGKKRRNLCCLFQYCV